MKVTDPWKKLLAALAAGGMFASSAAYAANLNQNLVVNGDFESVTATGDPTNYNAPTVLNWSGSLFAFAYSHDDSTALVDSSPATVPNYANGTPLPLLYGVGDHWYFTSNKSVFGPNFASIINAPGQFYQDVDVSGGDTGNLIATGNAHST